MTDIKLTKEQKEAIFSSGKNILVSASAGSGKTFVMTQRIIEKIKQGIDLEQLFVSTFTKKAATELKVRLEKELKKERRKTENSLEAHRFTLALQKLSIADIGTMDAFNQKLVKNYFNRIDLDPNFRILADQTESDLIKQNVFDELVENYLSNEIFDGMVKKDFEKLMKNFSKDRTITGFQNVVYTVYNFAAATENPIRWLKDDFLKGFETFHHFTDLSENFTLSVKKNLEALFLLLQSSLENGVISGKVGIEKTQVILDNQEILLSLLEKEDFSNFTEVFWSLDTDIRVGTSKNEDMLQLKRDFSAQKQTLVGSSSKPGQIRTFVNQIKHAALIEAYQPEALKVAKNLQRFLLTFYQYYLERKRSENAFEYADIAHFAIEILEENPDIRANLRENYEEVMIDEYQDTSHTQERMLELLSNGHNLFMVGDIKQSIYGFRLADPALFLDKYKTYATSENPNQLIRLKENFRSRGEILNFTNEVFEHLMDDDIGEMIYGKEERLIQGNIKDYPTKLDHAHYPELLLYKENLEDLSSENGSEEKISDGEIKIVAEKIKELIDSGIEPQKIALLVRSKSNNNKIEDILTSYDIPVVLDEGRVDFLKSMEVLVMLDVLRAIDNPLYDLSLVAMMRSPLFKFDEDELTRISLQASKEERFWIKIKLSIDKTGLEPDLISDQLQKKLVVFTKTFTHWRKRVNQISIHELLWKIYIETYYFDYVGALPNGEMRQANLQALSMRAESYETSGYKGLFRFIRMIDKFMEQNNDLASVNIKLPQNAVRVMTFHKAKGLEFDYVFLMNLQSRFNEQDLRANVILTRENGLGMKYIADLKKEDVVKTEFPYALVKMETLPYLANREIKQHADLSEEMRILYVAFTRAKQKLYLVGKIKEKEEKTSLDQYLTASLDHKILVDKFRKSSAGFQHWILALQSAMNLPMKTTILGKQDLQERQQKFTSRPNFTKLFEKSTQFDAIMENSDQIKQARKIMNFKYPYQLATQLASIQTPSQVKKRSYEKQLELGNIQPVSEFTRSGKFDFSELEEKKISATAIGSATHSFLQQVDFSHPDLFSFQSTLDAMQVDEVVKNRIDLPKILTLFDTELGKMMIDHAQSIVKEAPFSMLKTDEFAQEQYIVRGICDGFIKLQNKLILFDYKTDHFIHNNQIQEIKSRYRIQMMLYAEALKKAYLVDEIDSYLILLGGPDGVIVEMIEPRDKK